MKRLLLAAPLALALAASAIHPFGNPKLLQLNPATPLLEGANPVDPAALRILERACVNCHSEKTTWPWYSRIAPASWMIERDVSIAREHLNLSQWNRYTLEERRRLLAQIGVMVRNHQMPPTRYTLLHGEAKLSSAEVDILYRWERAERAEER